jgi:hypothetical protein
MGITSYKSEAVFDIYSHTEYCGCVVNVFASYFGGPVFKLGAWGSVVVKALH